MNFSPKLVYFFKTLKFCRVILRNRKEKQKVNFGSDFFVVITSSFFLMVTRSLLRKAEPILFFIKNDSAFVSSKRSSSFQRTFPYSAASRLLSVLISPSGTIRSSTNFFFRSLEWWIRQRWKKSEKNQLVKVWARECLGKLTARGLCPRRK